MSIALYEITNDMQELETLLEVTVDEKQEEHIKEFINTLETELKAKGENIIKVIRNKEAMIDARKAEIKRLQELNKLEECKIENLKQYTKECIENTGKKKVETVLGNLTVRKAQPSIKVIDATKLPKEFLITKTTINADKIKIKQHFKETGEILEGIEIEMKTSLTVPKAKGEE